MKRQRSGEGPLPPPDDRAGGWTEGVPLTNKSNHGHGSSTSYPSNGKRPFPEEKATEERGEFFTKPSFWYTNIHSSD